MAQISVEGDHAVIRLAPLEKVGAVHGDVRVPLSAIRDVSVVTQPFSELRGRRALGTGVPRVVALGTWRRRGHKEFAAIYRRRPAVVVELDPEQSPFDRLIVSVSEPADTLRLLSQP